MTKPTQKLILEYLSNLQYAVEIGASDPSDHPAPVFIQDMEDRQLLEWDVAVYELAYEALTSKTRRLPRRPSRVRSKRS